MRWLPARDGKWRGVVPAAPDAHRHAGWNPCHIGADQSGLRDMMRDVVTIGTGKKANVPGYDVIGKTGSANKPARGGYDDDALITSFLGAFPYSDPRYALLVMLRRAAGYSGNPQSDPCGLECGTDSGRNHSPCRPTLGCAA